MGSISEFRCDTCGYVKEILFGIGMLYPCTQQRVLSAVKNGDYGAEMQKAALDTPGIRVDAERYLYICSECGTWENDYGLSLYEPDRPENDEGDWVIPTEPHSNYHIRLRYFHKCPDCGKTMHRFREDDRSIRCPKCYHTGHIVFSGMWD